VRLVRRRQTDLPKVSSGSDWDVPSRHFQRLAWVAPLVAGIGILSTLSLFPPSGTAVSILPKCPVRVVPSCASASPKSKVAPSSLHRQRRHRRSRPIHQAR
jgi:hypothetical protein